MGMNGGVCRCIAEGVTGGYLASGGSVLLLFEDCLWIAWSAGLLADGDVGCACFTVFRYIQWAEFPSDLDKRMRVGC